MPIVLNGSTGVTFPNGDTQTGMQGALSELSGILTGAILESGSNEHGIYIKFSDGTLIQYMNRTETRTTSGTNTTLMTFPMPFVSSFAVPPRNLASYAAFATMQTTVPNTATNITTSNPTDSTIEVRIQRSDSVSTVFFLICIGRWY